METTLYQVTFNDDRIYRINCRGKNQKQRFKIQAQKLKTEIKSILEIANGIHNINEFEQLKK
jgi:hypothetical protein